MSENKFDLRPLKSTDLGIISKIVSGIGLKEFKACIISNTVLSEVNGDNKEDIAKKVGVEVVLEIAGIIVSNIPKVEKDVQKFASSVAGLTLEEVQQLSFADFGELIMQIILKDDFKDFFGRVVKLLK